MLFGGPIVGVVHLLPLPGSPRWGGSMDAVVERALLDARAYAEGGAHGIVVENYGDAPFLKGDLPPETVAALACCALRVREAVALPVGVNALRNDARAAVGIAAAVGAAFVRVNVHAGVVATDQGILEGRAAETLRVRAALRADVRILADVHVKHGRTLHCDDIAAAARDLVERGGADGVIVTGPATGAPADPARLRAVREAIPGTLLLAGSGVSEESIGAVLSIADAAIVGTSLKRGGKVGEPVEAARVRRLVAAAARLKG
jgi:membrane complex biogenesis BtpA family protein